MNDFNDIMAELKKVNNKIQIYIPSQNRDVEFNPITLSQQKHIIDKVMTSNFGIIDLFNGLYNVIKTSTTFNTDNLNTIDRINIILAFRKHIAPVYQDVPLDKLLEKNRTISLPPLTKTFTTDKFTFELHAPNLTVDYKYNNFIMTTYKDEKQIVGKMLVNEICKFIKQITINESNQVMELESLAIKNKFTVIESLNMNALPEVMDYINVIRDAEVLLTKFEDKQIEIGPEVFML